MEASIGNEEEKETFIILTSNLAGKSSANLSKTIQTKWYHIDMETRSGSKPIKHFDFVRFIYFVGFVNLKYIYLQVQKGKVEKKTQS